MKKQVFNPFLPLTEYIPDGEPHVFGDRVYLYGSHDKAGAERFCVQDYTVWSAPVEDLSNWRCHGVSYRKEQDPRSKPGKPVDFYAPDCVRGNDGRYYLYYCAMGPNTRNFGPMSVAVSDCPEGPFTYLGDVRNPDGTPMLRFLTNDPAVINDEGHIRLYYGWSINRDFRNRFLSPLYNLVQSRIFLRDISEIKNTKPNINGCAYAELEEDMLTVKGEPKLILDSITTAPKGSLLYKHPFYEAASIRKIGELYYLVYSSGRDNALAYATSPFPDRGFECRGVIISNADLGLNGNRIPKAPAGTIHGGIEAINGQYYIFYHRCTHTTDFSRQACAEPIEIAADGTIRQVEITSCGLNGKPLTVEEVYPASICCNLYTGKRISLGLRHRGKYPQIIEENGVQIVSNAYAGTTIVYKYFDFSNAKTLTLRVRGRGTVCIHGEEIKVNTNRFTAFACPLNKAGTGALMIEIRSGRLDILDFLFGGEHAAATN